MPFQSQRAPLKLSMEMREELSALAQSRAAPRSHSERARMLLAYADGTTVSAIARMLKTNRLKVERCLNKAVQFGPRAALDDLAGRDAQQRSPRRRAPGWSRWPAKSRRTWGIPRNSGRAGGWLRTRAAMDPEPDTKNWQRWAAALVPASLNSPRPADRGRCSGDPILDVGCSVGRLEQALIVGFVLGKEQAAAPSAEKNRSSRFGCETAITSSAVFRSNG
jgi:hypothetical protein